MSGKTNGERLWYFADAYIPPRSSGELKSHESICVLNTNQDDAHLQITIYFEDRPPIEKISVIVSGRRTDHIRTSSLEKDGQSIPVGTSYAIKVESDQPVILQYSRLDATQAENSLMTTVGYSPVG